MDKMLYNKSIISNIKTMLNKSQNGSSSIIAGAIVLGAIIVGVLLYLGLQKTSNINNSSTSDKLLNNSNEINQPKITAGTDEKVKVSNSKNNIQKEVTSQAQNNQLPHKKVVSDEVLIKQALLQVSNIPENKLEFEIADNNGQIARGTIKNKDDQGGAGWFAAKNQNTQNKWKVTYIGQGVPKCTEVNPYNYPTSWADYCLNSQGQAIAR